ncbi:YrkI [Bacillus cereus]|nr:YrkI [Bacillus cereus]
MNVKQVLDAKGLACPMPIVRTKKGSVKDIPAWANKGGHDIVKHVEEADVLKFWIKKA